MNYLHSQLFLQLDFKLDSHRNAVSKLLCLVAFSLHLNTLRFQLPEKQKYC